VRGKPIFTACLAKLERVAMAVTVHDNAGRAALGIYRPDLDDWENLSQTVRNMRVESARAAVRAMKYEDGADEVALLKASNQEKVEAVSLIMAFDAYLDAVLGDPS
jgi:hypothetical protein